MKKKCGAGLNFILRNDWVAKIGIANQNGARTECKFCQVKSPLFI